MRADKKAQLIKLIKVINIDNLLYFLIDSDSNVLQTKVPIAKKTIEVASRLLTDSQATCREVYNKVDLTPKQVSR